MELLVTTGDAFVRVGAGTRLEGSGAQCLAIGGDEVYVGCRGGGLQRSADGGDTFEDVALPERDVFSVAVSPVDGAVYAGTEPSRLFRSRDRGDTWEELVALQAIPSRPTWSFPPRPWTSHVRWIAPSPHDADVVLVGIELGGLMRTDDAGASFSDHRPRAARDVHCLTWHPTAPGRAYEAGGDGAAWSRDGGVTWDPADAGRERRYAWALAVDAADPELWFVSAAPGPFRAHGSGPADSAVYRWSADGRWEQVEGPLDSHVYALVSADGSLFAGLGDGTLLRSDDRGETWHDIGERVERVTALVAS
jgi:photosystem II stability/assembly factor-like uncharacterized protein